MATVLLDVLPDPVIAREISTTLENEIRKRFPIWFSSLLFNAKDEWCIDNILIDIPDTGTIESVADSITSGIFEKINQSGNEIHDLDIVIVFTVRHIRIGNPAGQAVLVRWTTKSVKRNVSSSSGGHAN